MCPSSLRRAMPTDGEQCHHCLAQALALAGQPVSSAAPAQLRAPEAESVVSPYAQTIQPPAEGAAGRGSGPSVSSPSLPAPQPTASSVSLPVSREEPVQRSSISSSSGGSSPGFLGAAAEAPGGAPAWVAELQVRWHFGHDAWTSIHAAAP